MPEGFRGGGRQERLAPTEARVRVSGPKRLRGSRGAETPGPPRRTGSRLGVGRYSPPLDSSQALTNVERSRLTLPRTLLSCRRTSQPSIWSPTTLDRLAVPGAKPTLRLRISKPSFKISSSAILQVDQGRRRQHGERWSERDVASLQSATERRPVVSQEFISLRLV